MQIHKNLRRLEAVTTDHNRVCHGLVELLAKCQFEMVLEASSTPEGREEMLDM